VPYSTGDYGVCCRTKGHSRWRGDGRDGGVEGWTGGGVEGRGVEGSRGLIT
jgi:hypothetical protein